MSDIHGGTVLDIIAPGVKQRLKGKRRSLRKYIGMRRPGHARSTLENRHFFPRPLERIEPYRYRNHLPKPSGIFGILPSEMSTNVSTALSSPC